MAPSALHQQLQLHPSTSSYNLSRPISHAPSSTDRNSNPDSELRTGVQTKAGWLSYLPTALSSPSSKFRPFESTPLEIIERILSFLPLACLLRLKRLDRSFLALLTSPHLYTTIHLSSTPSPPTELLALLPSLLTGTQSLSLRSFPLPTLQHLLPSLTPRLTLLDLSFSATRDEELFLLAEAGALEGVKELRVKGCRGVRDGQWLAGVLPSARTVDLSWSGLESLPSGCACAELVQEQDDDELVKLAGSPTGSDDSGFFELEELATAKPQPTPFPKLQDLTLSSLPHLPSSSLASFLSSLPPTLQSLDLSHASLSPSILSSLQPSPSLRSLNLVGNDRLTRRQIDGLKSRQGWDKVEVRASVVLLESESEEDVRRFIRMVAGLAERGGSARR